MKKDCRPKNPFCIASTNHPTKATSLMVKNAMQSAKAMGPVDTAVAKAISRYYVSPLRYPGGKRKLARHFAKEMDRAGVGRLDRLIEPFAGGAALSISLLEAGVSDEIVINDLDPLVYSFWKVVFSQEALRLADMVYNANVSLCEWEKQRAIQPTTDVDLAFKCLFLNRTSFSGTLNELAGPIGGKAQTGRYLIDCRWNPEALASRIEELRLLARRVRVRNWDFRRLVKVYSAAHRRAPHLEVAWYLDPPFFHKAEKLYRYFFDEGDHLELRNVVEDLDGNWMLSYDQCPEAREMYEKFNGRTAVDMRYTAAGRSLVQRIDTTELVVSNFGQSLRTRDDVQIKSANA